MEGTVVSYQDDILDCAILRVSSPHQCVPSLLSSVFAMTLLANS